MKHRLAPEPVRRHPTLSILLAACTAVAVGVGAAAAGGTASAPQTRSAALGAATAAAPTARAGAEIAPPGRPIKKTCGLDARLVPGCGVLWGVAPGAYTDLPASRALAQFEDKTGRRADILHVYHRGDQLFPTADEIAAAHAGGHRRLLLANWKVDWGTTWAAVAAGGADARIDRLAGYLKAHVTEPFYLALHHEPENEVNSGPGMAARDYAAMFRHTALRLRALGVTNAVFVLIYMAYEQWCVQPWFADLWPGDDVVDWIGFDPYLFAQPGGYGHGDFGYLVDRTSDPKRWPGFYSWATRTHPGKPLMLAEWGVFEYPADPAQKAWIFSTVAPQLRRYPAIRALVYFDSPAAPKGDTRPDSSGAALDEYRKLAESTEFAPGVD
jgi:hypothetical protein